jgi:KDO2-lipid IV(A) lauroyltransferase
MILLHFLGAVLSILPARILMLAGAACGVIMKLISRNRHIITLNNLRQAFPHFPEQQIYQCAQQAYTNLGIVLLEILCMPFWSLNQLKKRIQFTNIELLTEQSARGKGLVLLSGHYGNWELLAYAAGIFSGLSMMIVVKDQRNKGVANYINNARTKGGNTIVDMNKAARALLSALGNGKAVAMLADQAADPSRDVFIPFFGRPAVTYEAPAMLALRTGAPLIAGYAHRQKNGVYTVKLEIIESQDLSKDKSAIVQLTHRHVQHLEQMIIQDPGQWSWQHKRWKYEAS